MATITVNKTKQSDLLSFQSVAASTVVIGSDFNFSGKLSGTVFVRFGRRAGTAAGASANIRIEASPSSSGNDWFPIATIPTNFAAVESEAVSGTVSAGTNVITVASTTNLSAGVVIFIDNGTFANSEFGRIKSAVTNTSITIEENLVNAQTGSTIYAGAEIYAPITIPSDAGIMRIRAVDDGSLFTQAHAVQVLLVTDDSYTSA